MRLIDADELTEMVWRERLDTRERIADLIARQPTIKGAVKRCKMNKCYFCGKECGETVLTVSNKSSFQSELFRAYMCAECSEAVHSALILLRTITKGR